VLAYVSNAQKLLEEILADSIEELSLKIEKAGYALTENLMNADFALLLYPAALDLNPQKRGQTCIVIDMCDYRMSKPMSSRLVVPFTSKEKLLRTHELQIHAPGQMDRSVDFDLDLAMKSFFDGVNEDAEGSEVWSNCFRPE